MPKLLRPNVGRRASPGRFAMVLLLLALPLAVPAEAEAGFLGGVEKESNCKDGPKCLVWVQDRRATSERSIRAREPLNTDDLRLEGYAHQPTRHVLTAGHRLGNGLIAPLRC